jgi:hypothetical protein
VTILHRGRHLVKGDIMQIGGVKCFSYIRVVEASFVCNDIGVCTMREYTGTIG